MPLAPLPSSTVKLIGSSQVITSVSSVVKELMENSLDSGAQHVEIKLDKHGLEKIEIKDDGCGIGKSDATVLCLPNYTSKILDFSDLDCLSSYGFRGEALSSLCNVAQVSVTTKTADDDVATCYTYDHNGQVTCSKISHITKGTIVTVTDLFKNLPVRKQFVSSAKRAAEELKRVEKVVKSLGMVHPRLRVTLLHNKFLIWQKTSVANLRQSVMQVVNLSIVKQLHHILQSSDQIRVEMLVPKRDSNVSSLCFSNFADAYFLFINNRPVRSKEVEKAVYNKLSQYFGVYVPANKHPVCVTCLTVPPDCLDVNLEPNKTRVYLKNQDEVLNFINQCMHLYYGEGNREEEENLPSAKLPKKRRVEEGDTISPKKVFVEQINNNVKANRPPSDQDVQLSDAICNLGGSQSSLDTATCSGESTCQLESDAPGKGVDPIFEECKDLDMIFKEEGKDADMIFDEEGKDLDTIFEEKVKHVDTIFEEKGKDVDTIFEEFCLEREKESNNTTLNEDVHEISPLKKKCINSDNLSSRIKSKFFRCANSQEILNENEASSINKKYFVNFENGDKNSFLQTDSELEINECQNTGTKKLIDCLKNASDISMNMKKIQTLDAYLSTNNRLPPREGGSTANLVGQNRYQIDSGGLFEGPLIDPVGKSCQVDDEEYDQKEEFETNKQPRHGLRLSSPTLSQWSKGIVVGPAGANVQGPQLLARRMEPESPSTSQELTNRSVSSQMGCKEMSAFTKFARKMRKEILEDKPDLSFTKVAQMLQAQWRNLDTDEKKQYEETVKIKKSPNSTHTSKQRTISSFINCSPNVELDINMEKIRQMVKIPMLEVEDDIRLIGQLEASSLWLFHNRSAGVFILCVARLLEAVRYHQHLAEFSVPTKLLNVDVTITPSDLSVDEWELLLSLERSANGVIKHECFTKNGILIEITQGETEARISYIPQNIAYCGIEEVQEILKLLQTHGPNAPLAQCRPLKVISFIRSEVMRACSQEEPSSRPEEVSELLSYWLSSVSPQTPDCIHFRPVTQHLYTS